MTFEAEISTALSSAYKEGRLPVDFSLFIRAPRLSDKKLTVILDIPAVLSEKASELSTDIKNVLLTLDDVEEVALVITAQKDQAPPDLKPERRPAQTRQSVPGVKKLIAIGSGKGGVGKSTVSTNLAVAFAQKGLRVGLLDADIYGPSLPQMMGASGRPQSPDGKEIIPLAAHGVTVMSMGFLVEKDEAVIWRGPMLMGALQQMLLQVRWGALDILFIDLPPGTGDVQLTLSQKAEVHGALVVSTPQDVALLDARKAINMFEKTNTKILGLVENMAYHKCENCGHISNVFGEGGVASEAKSRGIALLGSLPLDISTRMAGDAGKPVVLEGGAPAEAFNALADALRRELDI